MHVTDWIRVGELALIAVTAAVELTALASIIGHVVIPLLGRQLRHGLGWPVPLLAYPAVRRRGARRRVVPVWIVLDVSPLLPDCARAWFRRRARRVTAFEQRIHGGRGVRILALLSFMAGAVQSTIEHWTEPLSVRSLFWIVGSTLTFIAWNLLDRRRWEIGVT